ncbi:class I SAM-dependent methyltransferase [Desulfobulbus sp. F4]|nr:class I SAM-dependent methyltransferase [Desulfobulbus sp. F3]MCW5200576.1 class I SAM-dependent methyltransferase [Desulfobulbus sp. F4]
MQLAGKIVQNNRVLVKGVKEKRMSSPLECEFRRHGPWRTKFVIQGQTYGGEYDAANDPRLDRFAECFPHAEHILELGSLEGGHTFALASQPQVKQLTAVEGRSGNLRRAQFVQRLLGIGKVRFVAGNLESFDLESLGAFDVAVCMGLLYHLPEPWVLLERLRRVAPAIYLWTHYAEERQARQTRHGYRGRIYREWLYWFEVLSGLSARSFWPTLKDLILMAQRAGYNEVVVVADEPGHVHGPAVTLSCRCA